jgi:hypothetical protein
VAGVAAYPAFVRGSNRDDIARSEVKQAARWFHFWLTIAYVGFFLVHVVQVIRAGWNNFRAMIIDYEISPDKMAKREEVPDEQSISPS